jgi:hypothetical protein
LMNYLFKKDISYDNNNIILLKMMLEWKVEISYWFVIIL